MASINGRIKVRVKPESQEGKREITLQLSAPEELFHTADLLASKGAIRKLEQSLKESAKRAALDYIKSADLCLEKLKTLQTGEVA